MNDSNPYSLLETIDDPADLRQLSPEQLPLLADQNTFENLLYGLSAAIGERQTLSIPIGRLPRNDADLDRLVSAHVLDG